MTQDFSGSSFGGGYTAMMHLDLYHTCPCCALQRCHGNVAFLVHQGILWTTISAAKCAGLKNRSVTRHDPTCSGWCCDVCLFFILGWHTLWIFRLDGCHNHQPVYSSSELETPCKCWQKRFVSCLWPLGKGLKIKEPLVRSGNVQWTVWTRFLRCSLESMQGCPHPVSR